MTDICNISFKYLTSLPENLPDLLTQLWCHHNKLTSLPENLPADLKCLGCSCNQLTSLPDNLPATLKELRCDDNQITLLPDLPNSLKCIDLHNNPLEANYPKIFTFQPRQAKEIITYVRECNARRRARERLAIINAGNVLLERYMRRVRRPL